MRALLQRVRRASVSVDGGVIGEVGQGYLILLGVRQGDTKEEARFLAQKTAELRVFEDAEGKMNLSLLDVGGGALVVSQFTLCADCRKGRRPAFINAEKPPLAEELYLDYVSFLKEAGVGRVDTGKFGAEMLVSIENDGPVTILLDTDEIMKHREAAK
ncbi:D-aminoacyl-tRNA deacylase [Yanshouia hominis]|uniref:D-aminoacyl-tRNA deacylase n=1 Tax=Yanshouia hominis TaxID=2763673 RepID=A0ABR7NJR5_9FIRM|nr:D-aminoacyl-tRNA deacylase [Yanshouia hominis]MBC8576641.1 D-tyrosyl-tRNA(Tyr) deacylase [Yanshouia hominis]